MNPDTRPQGPDHSDTRPARQRIPLQSRRRRQVMTGLAAALAVVLLLVVTTAMSRSRPDAGTVDSPTTRILPVSRILAKQADSWQVQRKYTGTILARRKSRLGFELAGKVVELLVDEGEFITAGTPLARLDTRQLDARRAEMVAQRNQARSVLAERVAGPRAEVIDSSRAAVAALSAQVKLLELELVRHEELVRTRAVSVSDYDTVRFDLQSRRAELQQARHQMQELLNGTRQEQIDAARASVAGLDAGIRQIDVQLDKSTMRAPFDGTVSSRMVDEGTVVTPGQAVLRLVEVGRLEAWIGLPAAVAVDMAVGQSLTVDVDGQEFMAEVSGLVPEIDPATQTRTVILSLDSGAPGRLVDGQVVRLGVAETIEESGFWLPLSALQKDTRGLWICFVLEPVAESGANQPAAEPDAVFQVSRRYLEVLHSEQDRAFVRGTLNDADPVIDQGGHRIVDGQIVRIGKHSLLSNHAASH